MTVLPGSVTLDEASPFAAAQSEMRALVRHYPIDRLLAVFRRAAGIDTRGAEPPGGWEQHGHPEEQAWTAANYPGAQDAPTANLLRGHYAGHVLSAMAYAAAADDDDALRARVAEFVAGLAEVQRALADLTGEAGYLAAYGPWQFARLEEFAPYGEIWAPYYTCHKLLAGLVDAAVLADAPGAMDLAMGLADWVDRRLRPLPAEQRQRMWGLYIAGEYGGMNEVLARMSLLTGEARFARTAALFDLDALIDAGVAGTDILDGMHANQHLPMMIGWVRQFEATGERRYLDAAHGLWRQIVPGRLFAHGGTGSEELWGPADAEAAVIGLRNAEGCASVNLRLLARELFRHGGGVAQLDYATHVSLNHLLAARRPGTAVTTPDVAYMLPVHPGALAEFDNVGTCCGGTGVECHVRHDEGAVLLGGDGEVVVTDWLPMSAEVDGLRLRLESSLPFGEDATLHVEPAPGIAHRTLVLHLPAWASGARVLRDGVAVEVPADRLLRIDLVGDAPTRIDVHLPQNLTVHPARDDDQLVSLRLGPTVLALRDDATTLQTIELDVTGDPLGALRTHGAVRVGGRSFIPLWQATTGRYHVYFRASSAMGQAVRVVTDPPASITGWHLTAPTVSVVDESGHAIAGAELRIDGDEPRPAPHLLTQEGRVRLTAVTPDDIEVTVDLHVDTAPPEVHARVRLFDGQAEITLSATDEASGVEAIHWGAEGTFWATFQETFVRSLEDRPQRLRFSARDRAGNIAEEQTLDLPARGVAPEPQPNVTWT